MANKEDEPERIDYQPEATLASDIQVLRSMIFANVQGNTQVKYCDNIMYGIFIINKYSKRDWNRFMLAKQDYMIVIVIVCYMVDYQW